MKDPAFLFYSNDFLSGTYLMNNEQVGKYIRLLCLQHQKGCLSKKDMLNICKTYDEDIFSKFTIDENGNYFNIRLKDEFEKRRAYSESRSINRKSKKVSKTYVKHMEDENVIINKDKNKKLIKDKLSFYSEQIKSNKEENLIDKYTTLVKYLFGENAIGCPVEYILKLQNQLKFDEYKKLFKKAHAKNLAISEMMDSWLNNPTYSKGKVSVYLTLNSWINKSEGKTLKPSPEKKWTEVVKTGETLSLLEIINKMSKHE